MPWVTVSGPWRRASWEPVTMVARRFAGSKLDTIAAVKPARQSDALLKR